MEQPVADLAAGNSVKKGLTFFRRSSARPRSLAGNTSTSDCSGRIHSGCAGALNLNSTESKRREVLIDFYRSCSMLFVFYHHTMAVFPGNVDLFAKFNPFAELFIGISGFMVG